MQSKQKTIVFIKQMRVVRSIGAGSKEFFPIPNRYRWYRPIPSTRCRYRSHPSHKGHDTIQYHTKYRDTIRKCFTVCKNRKQAGNSAQHSSTVVLPINTVAAAGAWILAVRRGGGHGRPARRPSAGGRCSLKSRVIQQGYCEYWPPNNSSCRYRSKASEHRMNQMNCAPVLHNMPTTLCSLLEQIFK